MRKAIIPKREIQVLKRLREAREKLGLAQPDFAAQVEITRGRLANYEYQKTPLPCDLALRICRQFIIGERWLATGQGPMRQFMTLSPDRANPMIYRMPFGQAYDLGLAAAAEKEAVRLEKEGSLFIIFKPHFWSANRQFYKNFINALLDGWMDGLEREGKKEDWGDLVRLLADSGQDHFAHLADRVLKVDPKTDEPYWESATTGERWKFDPLETEDQAAERKARKATERARHKRYGELAKEMAAQQFAKKAPK